MQLGGTEIDLLIGSPAIDREGIMPLDALRSKVRKQEGRRNDNRDRSRHR